VLKQLRKMARDEASEFASIMGAGMTGALAAVVVSGIFVDYIKAEIQIWCAALLLSLIALEGRAVAVRPAAERVAAPAVPRGLRREAKVR
jgi:hypothetical protein